MKKYSMLFALIAMSISTAVAQQFDCVNARRSGNGSNVTMDLVFSGRNVSDIRFVAVTLSSDQNPGASPTVIYSDRLQGGSNPGAQHTISMSGTTGSGVDQSTLNRAIITVTDIDGNIYNWGVQYFFGSGTRTTASSTGNKPELL